jgi:hypothetical protein
MDDLQSLNSDVPQYEIRNRSFLSMLEILDLFLFRQMNDRHLSREYSFFVTWPVGIPKSKSSFLDRAPTLTQVSTETVGRIHLAFC